MTDSDQDSELAALEKALLDETADPIDIPFSLLKAITGNFSQAQVIGRGGYGVVYKGVLPGGHTVAVKKLFERFEILDKNFESEVACLVRVKHMNTVRFLGYCSETQHVMLPHDGKLVWADVRQRLLCFEYLPRGCLADHLSDASCRLHWATCYQIIKGICEGVHYLHRQRIIHMDLKPQNVLLDNNMVPRIADFGLSRRLSENQSRTIIENKLGTMGYMAPEFLHNGEITFKTDIYSLGVMIMQIIAGHRECSDVHEEDESQNKKFRTSKSQTAMEQVKVCADIGIKCTNYDPANRPATWYIIREFETLGELEISNWSVTSDVATSTDRQIPNPNILAPQPDAVQEVSPQERTQIGSTLHMTLQQLKDITNNFWHELGRGGFGVVYKGMLESGQIVAVKKLMHTMLRSQEQFENEVNLLIELKHPNIVRLLGYCYEMHHLRIPHQGKTVFAWNVECLLCLEYLTNGSLNKYISDASSGLDWPTRCKIIQGISCGLQYIHEQFNDPILHLDLKPANILLDENMEPKITDFGLSRIFDKAQTICTATTVGTIGYMAPEYLQGTITPMSDIFCLGVIIMELITGHRNYPYDIRTSSKDFIEHELQKWRIMLQKGPEYTSLEADCQQIKTFLQIGLVCVNPERAKRPAIKKVIDMLRGLESMDWYITNEVTSPVSHTVLPSYQSRKAHMYENQL